MKTGCLRERVNRRLLARQEVPISPGSGPAVLARVNVALRLGQSGRVFRLETDRDRIKVLAEIERNRFHRAQFAVEDFGAQRGTIKINEREHDRLLPEVIAQMHGLSVLIAKDNFRWNRFVEALRDAHFAQNRRWAYLLRARGKNKQRNGCRAKCRCVSYAQGLVLAFGAVFSASEEVPLGDALTATGSHFCNSICIARAMATRTVPSSRLSQAYDSSDCSCSARNLSKSWRGFTCNCGPVGNCPVSENGEAGARWPCPAEKCLNSAQHRSAVNTSTRLRTTRKPKTPRTFASRVSYPGEATGAPCDLSMLDDMLRHSFRARIVDRQNRQPLQLPGEISEPDSSHAERKQRVHPSQVRIASAKRRQDHPIHVHQAHQQNQRGHQQ